MIIRPWEKDIKHSFNIVCFNCGFRSGSHYNITCPNNFGAHDPNQKTYFKPTSKYRSLKCERRNLKNKL